MSVVQDSAIEHNYGRLVLIPRVADGVMDDGTDGIPLSLGAGTPGFAEMIAAAEQAGLALDTNDEVYFLIDREDELWDADLDEDVRVILKCTSKKAGTHAGIDFQVDLKGVAADQALSDAKVSPDASLTMPVMTITDGAGKSAEVEHHANAPGVFKDDRWLMVAVTLTDKGDGAADDLFLNRVVIRYTRAICHPSGRRQIT